MNERIKELAEQARTYARYYVAECKCHGYYMEHNELEVRFEKKFAELIVRECLDIVEAQKESLCDNENTWCDQDYGYEQAVNDSVDMVKKHFGVEE